MRLHGVIDLKFPAEQVLRHPSFWDKVKMKLGGNPDLRTDMARASFEATALVDATQQALKALGITNAISLVIDDQVLFQDRKNKKDDLGDLFLAFHDNASVFGQGFKMMRLAAEHVEAGLHLVVEVVARTEHPLGEPSARLHVGGRIRDFEPKSGEDAEAYRARVEPLTSNAALLATSKVQFESFVTRVRDQLAATIPEAKVEVAAAELQIQKPPREGRKPAAPLSPTDHRYDPMGYYYPSPMGTMLSMMMWSSVFHMGMGPSVVVVNDHGDTMGNASDLDPAQADSMDDGGGDGGDDGFGGDGDGDLGGDGMDGDFDGGDFGGDFGGGDW
jgi:hypothetical protein